ncbi:enterotoxin [Silvibacterium sp.]|uniref:enterotoxin n=1 Tax=Silvibacterium sp. TaxID=1964179 RepID=UPI0039E5DC37
MKARPRKRGLCVCASAVLALATTHAHATTVVENRTLRVTLQTSAPELVVEDTAAHRTLQSAELFAVTLKDGRVLKPSAVQWVHGFTASAQGTCAEFKDDATATRLTWCIISHADRHYVRETLSIRNEQADLPITDVQLIDFPDAEAHVSGTVKGSPIVDSSMFLGFEHPISWSRVTDGRAQAGIARVLPLRKGQSVTYSAVIGTAEPGQMRRDFLHYLEQERPRPYKPFLHYNSWFDIGYTNRYGEADAIDRIQAFGRELVQKRGVKLDSFLFDDGWDNPNSFWGFDSQFPDGFTKTAEAAKQIGAGIGVWLSPWGGYGDEKKQRVAYGVAHGYETIKDGYALSGPKYYEGFLKVCMEMVNRYGVNQFKLDGTGNADRVFPGSAFDSDFDAAIHAIRSIREARPDTFINLTTGTYPSPFWVLYADSIWRGGEDHDFSGVGSDRQRWITYRDAQTYKNIVQGGPLFPLNSLMLHGVVYAKQAKALTTDPKNEFGEEVQSYFGSGTQLQELYITPSLMTSANWDTLAKAAKWSRAHSAILEDTHWIGGDPDKLEAYGWAAWKPQGWIVTLRNPSDKPQRYVLRLHKALELPKGAPSTFAVSQPFAESASTLHWSADAPVSIELKPFEVKTFESEAAADIR